MKKLLQRYAMLVMLVSILPGCARVMNWIDDSFYQGEQVTRYTKVPHSYIRSVKLYDQFSTTASFDALWLSDDVRTAYTNTYALKNGKTDTIRKAYLRRQLEENRHFISFYVLTNNIVLGESHNRWAVFLDIQGSIYYPIEIKTVDLSPEYQSFFGNRFNRFKTAWLVKFNAKDNADQSLLDGVNKMRLYFRSINRESSMVWHIPPKKYDQRYIDSALDRRLA